VSLYHPVFSRIEPYTPGVHRGMYFNMHQKSNRSKQVGLARESLGVDSVAAGRLMFAVWLVEMRILSDDPSTEPLPVAQARPHDLEAWWTLDDGEQEVRTDHQLWPSWEAPAVGTTAGDWRQISRSEGAARAIRVATAIGTPSTEKDNRRNS
jgi:hypothetical protein